MVEFKLVFHKSEKVCSKHKTSQLTVRFSQFDHAAEVNRQAVAVVGVLRDYAEKKHKNGLLRSDVIYMNIFTLKAHTETFFAVITACVKLIDTMRHRTQITYVICRGTSLISPTGHVKSW